MIRRFELTDLDRILDIERRSFPKSPYSRSTFLHLYALNPRTFLVAVSSRQEGGGEEIRGYILFSEEGHLISLAVHPDFRRKGLGKALIETAARALLPGGMWAEVRFGNLGAIAFYRKMGFQIAGRIPDYYGNEDAWIVRKVNPKDRADKILDREEKGG